MLDELLADELEDEEDDEEEEEEGGGSARKARRRGPGEVAGWGVVWWDGLDGWGWMGGCRLFW
jgi:hypothetical protein